MTAEPAGAVESLRRASPNPHAITIGNFDGVHRGHLHLISLVVNEARRNDVASLVVTFEPHPTSVLRPEQPFERLTSPVEKLRLLQMTGADDIVVIPFDLEFAALQPDEFLDLVHRELRPTHVFVGEGFRFGHGRAGSGETIRAYGDTHGFATTVIPRIRDGEAMISSSAVRDAIKSGDISTANSFLGRRYRLTGTVEHGMARGRELGFPTANLQLRPDACLPADGIYAAWVHTPGGGSAESAHRALVYVGSRPTFDEVGRVVEAYLLEFSGDLYTLELTIEFVDFIRPDARFDSAEVLMRQMADDEAAARRILLDTQPEPDSAPSAGVTDFGNGTNQ